MPVAPFRPVRHVRCATSLELAGEVVLTMIFLALSTAPLVAQDRTWEFEGEIGGAVFFGNTSQTTFSTRAATEKADSAREFSAGARFSYGQARDGEGGSFVNKRSWKFGASYTHRPFGRFGAFLSSDLEGSLERRIDLRYDLGLGARMQLQRSDRGRTDLSLALLAERTEVRDGDEDDQLLARWSARFRVRRDFAAERVALASETQYRPELEEPDEFTLSSTSSLGFELNRTVTLKLTFVDNCDSGARTRGADSNNEGQLLFSVLSSF